jgi:hypothetical protein
MNNKSIFELLFKTVTQSCDTVKLAGGMSFETKTPLL